ncbi:MAG: TA system VapC family ribonuclease toxin [Acidimicrobiia bacterium]
MFLVDANVLIYAVNTAAHHHQLSLNWLDSALEQPSGVAFSWLALIAFARISTHKAVLPNPITSEEAFNQINRWLSAPGAVVVNPTHQHAALLSSLVTTTGTGSNLINDAHLATLAIEHNAVLVSFDHDFARFPGLRYQVPQTT